MKKLDKQTRFWLKVADFYEEEVDTAIDGVSSIIEPVMIVAMGIVIALVAVSVYGSNYKYGGSS